MEKCHLPLGSNPWSCMDANIEGTQFLLSQPLMPFNFSLCSLGIGPQEPKSANPFSVIKHKKKEIRIGMWKKHFILNYYSVLFSKKWPAKRTLQAVSIETNNGRTYRYFWLRVTAFINLFPSPSSLFPRIRSPFALSMLGLQSTYLGTDFFPFTHLNEHKQNNFIVLFQCLYNCLAQGKEKDLSLCLWDNLVFQKLIRLKVGKFNLLLY